MTATDIAFVQLVFLRYSGIREIDQKYIAAYSVNGHSTCRSKAAINTPPWDITI